MGGTIFLYDETETLVRVREYRNPNERKAIVNSWQLSIGERFLSMATHITPNARVDLVKIDGTNGKRSSNYKKYEPPPSAIIRPKAVYDNDLTRSLYPQK